MKSGFILLSMWRKDGQFRELLWPHQNGHFVGVVCWCPHILATVTEAAALL